MNGDPREFAELLSKFDVAHLTTRGGDGRYRTRPMALQRHEADGTLWFATSLDTQKCEDLQRDPHCAVSMVRDGSYVSISGFAELVRDPTLVHELWDVSWRAWFPEGPHQADLVLLRIRPEHVEYVHATGGKLKVLFTGLRRVLTHERVELAPKKELDFGGEALH